MKQWSFPPTKSREKWSAFGAFEGAESGSSRRNCQPRNRNAQHEDAVQFRSLKVNQHTDESPADKHPLNRDEPAPCCSRRNGTSSRPGRSQLPRYRHHQFFELHASGVYAQARGHCSGGGEARAIWGRPGSDRGVYSKLADPIFGERRRYPAPTCPRTAIGYPEDLNPARS
jgi:hypothetical protein